jgi:hypothetical protein
MEFLSFKKIKKKKIMPIVGVLQHLKFFGCVSYAHVPDELRKKLDNKGQKLYLLGILKTQKDTSCMTLSQENL